ncbi:type II restriction enzyme [Levilactobacillus suantsaii]|uniref:Uncharacterized protein n=2 Tax=Levilactobacillus suantsaii TaxID=2292255 RepID=A0A4Q0VKD1_9LACO|nr:hypothetical protein [Levilactobacillus suantsaii]RXI78767.1 hypothetical protein DXH47_05895 [Levilactobacillus suantsaii]
MGKKFKLHYALESYNKRNNKPSYAWEILFKKYDIVNEIETHGYYDIKTDQMMRNNEVIQLWQRDHAGVSIPDNRNILKFDFSADLPNIFKGYRLQIMPLGGNTYRIAPFQMYHQLKNEDVPVIPMASPFKIASLDFNHVTTEPNAQTVAEVTGMLAYVFHDLNPANRMVVSTLSGKNNIRNIKFNVQNVLDKQPITFDIETWQAEIDGVYESEESILIIESKMKFPKDFNIRQLFIPRLLIEQIMTKLQQRKDVYAGYFVKTKDIYIFTIYKFTDLMDMNSIKLQRQYKFSLPDDPTHVFTIEGPKRQATPLKSVADIQDFIEEISVQQDYPRYSNGAIISFPQANNLQIALDYLELLDGPASYTTINDESVPRVGAEAFVDAFKYDRRQYNYYLNWLGYLGFVDREAKTGRPVVTTAGRNLREANLNQRNRILIYAMAQHLSSRETLHRLLNQQKVTNDYLIQVIQQEMQNVPARSRITKSTLPRRISSVKSMCKQVLAQMQVFDRS